MSFAEDKATTPSAVTPRALVWVVATLGLQSLQLLAGRRYAGETAPFLYALCLGLAWLACSLGTHKGASASRRYWVRPQVTLFVQAAFMILLLSLATHSIDKRTLNELYLGILLLAVMGLLSALLARDTSTETFDAFRKRGTRLFLVGCFGSSLYLLGASMRPSENAVMAALVIPIFFVLLPNLAGLLLAWLLSKLPSATWRDDLAQDQGLRLSTNPGHTTAAFALSHIYFNSSFAFIAFPALLVLFGYGTSRSTEPVATPKALGWLFFPLALPLLAAATIHVFDPPIVVDNVAASHAVVGIFFVALMPVLPAMSLAIAAVIDRARGVRALPGVGLIAAVILISLVVAAPHLQQELAGLFRDDLVSEDGSPVWTNLPVGNVHQAQALAGLLLVAWTSTRAWQMFRRDLQPSLLPLAFAAVATVGTAALRVPIDGATGAAYALAAGALIGLLIQLLPVRAVGEPSEAAESSPA